MTKKNDAEITHEGTPELLNTKAKRAEEIYAIFRDYIQHEDHLINQRTTWLMSIQSFLIATFGFSYQKKFEILSKAFLGETDLVPAFCTSVAHYDLFLFSLVTIGFFTSMIAVMSVGAAANALTELQKRWSIMSCFAGSKVVLEECRHLPDITGGGHEKASKQGIRLARWLPYLFTLLWIFGAIFVAIASYNDFDYFYVNKRCDFFGWRLIPTWLIGR